MEYRQKFLTGLTMVLPIFASLSISWTASAQVKCSSITAPIFQRDTQDIVGDFSNPRHYLAEKSRRDVFGTVESRYSKEFDTRFYFTATSPMLDESLPFQIDPDVKAIVIFGHGSGTALSSGKNFYGLMNTLAKHGIAGVAYDFPYHGNGPHDPRFKSLPHFLNWLTKIILYAKMTGKDVYLLGHSFGPDTKAEVVYRFPFLVDGFLAMSPAGFTKTLSDWNDRYTSKMKFGGEVYSNDAGGQWAAEISQQFQWNKKTLPDPTIVNPNLKVHLLYGDREEYAPAPIGGPNKTPIGKNTYDIGRAYKNFFQNVKITVAKDVGHYIFSHTNEQGYNTVLASIFDLIGHPIEQSKKLLDETSNRMAQSSYVERALVRYSYDRNFKSWIRKYLGEKGFLNKMKSENEFLAKNLLGQYELAMKSYELKLAEYLAGENPKLSNFQKMNSNAVLNARKNMKDGHMPLLIAFSNYIENKSTQVSDEMLSDFFYQFADKVPNL